MILRMIRKIIKIIKELLIRNTTKNFIDRVTETFKMFYYYPLLLTGGLTLLCIILKSFNIIMLPILFLISYLLYTAIWFFLGGQGKLEIHEGDE